MVTENNDCAQCHGFNSYWGSAGLCLCYAISVTVIFVEVPITDDCGSTDSLLDGSSIFLHDTRASETLLLDIYKPKNKKKCRQMCKTTFLLILSLGLLP